MQGAGDAQVEVGIVDEDGDVGPRPIHLGQEVAEDPSEAREVRHHLPEPDHREVAHVGEQPRAFGLQALAAQPEDVRRRGRPATEVPDEVGGVQVAGRLTARDQEPRHGRAV